MSIKIGLFVLLLAAAALMVFIAYLSLRRGKEDVARYCGYVMLAASVYAFGYAFEMMSTGLEQAKLWLKVQYAGIPFITTLWLILALAFTGHKHMLRPRYMPLLFAIPAMTFILHYTNDSHHLFYREVRFEPGAGDLFVTRLIKGPWYWVHISYLYLEAAVGMGLFVRMYASAVPFIRRQVVLLALGASAPWLANMIFLMTYDRLNVDWTPLGFTVSGLVYLWGIYRFNLLRLVPIAYQTVFETMQDGVIIVDDECRITHVNQSACGIFPELAGYGRGQVSAPRIFAPYPELASKAASPDGGEARIVVRLAEGTRHYHVKISEIYDRSRHMALGKILIFHDITQVTLYQEQLIAGAEQLKELHDFKDKLFAMVTHDIRDPLGLLVNLTEMIEEDYVEAGSDESVVFAEIGGKVRDTYMRVENLLDWFRSQRGGILDFKPLVWELEPIVRQAALAMKHRADLKNIHMTVDVEGDLRALADKEMLEMILRNLLFNAIKFTEPGGIVHVGAAGHAHRERIVVFVRDTGAGVDPAVRETLFRDVREGGTAGTRGERGTGLGLFLCGKFVRLHGGDIWFESEPGQGSTFSFSLPGRTAAGKSLRTWKEADAL